MTPTGALTGEEGPSLALCLLPSLVEMLMATDSFWWIAGARLVERDVQTK